MSNNLVLVPVLIPFMTAIMLLFFYKKLRMQLILSAVSAICGLAASFYLFSVVLNSGIQVFWSSNWVPPFGIIMVADTFTSILVILSNIVGAACLIFSFSTIDTNRARNFYYVFFQMLLAGVNGSFLTGDIFNLFVFFEIMLLASYAMLVLGSTPRQLRESFKYVILNVLSASLFLFGIGLLYAMVGTLNLADIAQKMAQIENQGLVTIVAMIFLVVFGMKAAIFPLYFWLPQSYVVPPPVVSALFGSLLTKVGIYALFRVFTLIFVGETGFTHHTIILTLGAGTMFFGALGAIFQTNVRSILAYLIISHIGYLVMGLGLYSELATAGSIYYIAHHIIVGACLFLLAGVMKKITGTEDIREMGGLLHRFPVLGWTFFIAALSLAGIPPFSGFFSKLVLMQGAVEQGQFLITGVVLLAGFLTLFPMIKVFQCAFWGEEKPVLEQGDFNYLKLMPVSVVLVTMSILMGLGAQFMMKYATLVAEQMMNPQVYIDAVLNFSR
jgi:multicomponent Na+:H+ antiporter subunit D